MHTGTNRRSKDCPRLLPKSPSGQYHDSLPLTCYPKTLSGALHPALEPTFQTDIDLLGQVQRRVLKKIAGLEHLSHEDRLSIGVVQPGAVQALGKPYFSLLIYNRSL